MDAVPAEGLFCFGFVLPSLMKRRVQGCGLMLCWGELDVNIMCYLLNDLNLLCATSNLNISYSCRSW